MPQPTENKAGLPASRQVVILKERPGSGHLRTCLMAIFHCDAVAGRPGEREDFSCLGSSRTTPGLALNHLVAHDRGGRRGVNLLQKNVMQSMSPEEKNSFMHEGGNLQLSKLRLSSNEGHVNVNVS